MQSSGDLSPIEDKRPLVPDKCFWRKGVSPSADKGVPGDHVPPVDPLAPRVGLASALLYAYTHGILLDQ